MSSDLQIRLMIERLMQHKMLHQYRPSGDKGVHGEHYRGDTLGIAWNVPGEYHGNGNNKQQHCNAPQNVSLVLSNYRIEKFPCRSLPWLYRFHVN
ncbi:hypothetical protein E2C01_030687 [Portunus trituberculatus]|uniref:Uncharacterized protein n=1 Tax=Portunus trituberculatus TaxID=210409 RepID=A0A5B7EWF6_PORTR|nr:hypothetical protein [Portunus trituberculatus]